MNESIFYRLQYWWIQFEDKRKTRYLEPIQQIININK